MSDVTFEQNLTLKAMKERHTLALSFMVFLIIWFAFLFLVVYVFTGVSIIEALALGTATGVFLSCFKDMWQFYFRKGGKPK